ncbi:Fic family protein [Janthinobacterium sp. JC611]|uniref:Fic family protein n=1 Tax=Janthinobacterium sp. JC611 TaxID=2816201 RepID=UPI001BFE3345|nr:Fic family protein [Janthinobacterium sp. JC611]
MREIVESGNLLYRERLGTLEFREKHSAAISCLCGYLKWSGASIRLDSVVDIAPVPAVGPDIRMLQFIGRRLGIRMRLLSRDDLQAALEAGPVLLQRESGYALLLLARENEDFIAALPGAPKTINSVPADSDILEQVSSLHALEYLGGGPALRRHYRAAKLFLIPWKRTYFGTYSGQVVTDFNREFSRLKRTQADPAPLSSMSCKAMLASHRSICPSLPRYFGVYRRINLRRASLFVDVKSLPQALDALLRCALSNPATQLKPALEFASRLMVDFLSIHPFVNGNRRMGMVLVSKYLEPLGVDIDWHALSRVECYYWIRCASKGHFGGLTRLLHANVLSRKPVAGPIVVQSDSDIACSDSVRSLTA